jgi:hypothetical protein
MTPDWLTWHYAFWSFLALLGVFGAAAIYQYISHPNILWFILVALIGAEICFTKIAVDWLKNRPKSDSESVPLRPTQNPPPSNFADKSIETPKQATPATKAATKPTTKTLANGRIVVNISIPELTALHKGHTALQAKKLTGPYIGQWISVSGEVRDVIDVTHAFGVRLQEHVFSAFFFSKRWRKRIELLRLGDHVTILGKISEINSTDIKVRECELLDV